MISSSQLYKYAQLLVGFGLNAGKGPQSGQTICITLQDSAKDFLPYLIKSVYEYDCYPLVHYIPSSLSSLICEYANETQIAHILHTRNQGIVDQSDHWIDIISPADPLAMQHLDGKKVGLYDVVESDLMMKMFEKENRGQLSWTEGLFATEGLVRVVGMTLDEYREQIINACFLDAENPIQKNRDIIMQIEEFRDKLNSLDIIDVHMQGPDCDLYIHIGDQRKWMTGGYKNIPSFEIFTSPDRRGTNGWIRFTQPLYVTGKRVSDIFLRFENGVVVEYNASENKEFFGALLATKGGSMIGEFSMTDTRFSRINKPMAVTLYDENMGGPYGNSHIAIGNAYLDTFVGEIYDGVQEEFGFNSSDIHYDLIITTQRTITATTKSGAKMCIYSDGKFVV